MYLIFPSHDFPFMLFGQRFLVNSNGLMFQTLHTIVNQYHMCGMFGLFKLQSSFGVQQAHILSH